MKYGAIIKKLIKEKDRLAGIEEAIIFTSGLPNNNERRALDTIKQAISLIHEAELCLREYN